MLPLEAGADLQSQLSLLHTWLHLVLFTLSRLKCVLTYRLQVGHGIN